MKAKCSVVLSLLMVLGSVPAMAQKVETYSAAEVHRAMFDAISSIEEAAGMEPRASWAIAEMSDESVEMLFSSIANKERFVSAAQHVVERVEAARVELRGNNRPGQSDGSDPWLTLASTAPFTPDYPASSDLAYTVALGLGLVSSPDDRCGGETFDYYVDVLDVAEETMAIGDAACTVAACEITGAACFVACGLVEAVKLAVLAAGVPLRACETHGANVDSAEIEAGYENTVGILLDLAAHDLNIDGDLAAHDANIDGDLAAHDARILARLDALEAMMTDVLANQAEIIKLLKTPHGRREGWNKQP